MHSTQLHPTNNYTMHTTITVCHFGGPANPQPPSPPSHHPPHPSTAGRMLWQNIASVLPSPAHLGTGAGRVFRQRGFSRGVSLLAPVFDWTASEGSPQTIHGSPAGAGRSVSAPPRIRGPPLLRTCALPPDFPPNSPFTPGVYNLLQYAVTRYYVRSRARPGGPDAQHLRPASTGPARRRWSLTRPPRAGGKRAPTAASPDIWGSKYAYNLPGASPDIRVWSITKLKQALERCLCWGRDRHI
ncbi:hypothetical protein EDC01DRAFT_132997 [Geopyxis carbonaria]|nr:hypothetical protein EDC01DRAFT_132997 [Geopyxis carbonaria]